jgi:sterol 3beta-glucosyltransferase
MRVAIPALGTRGDVQPYALLGVGLRAAGHDVHMATHEVFRPLVEDCGLRFETLPGDPQAIFDRIAWERDRISPWRPVHHARMIHQGLSELVGRVRPDELLAGWAHADAIVFGPTTTFGHWSAQELGVPSIMAALAPSVATSAFPQPVTAPLLRLGGWANYASWLVGERLQRQTFKEPLRPAARRAHGLPRLPHPTRRPDARWPPFPVLHAYGQAAIPRPPDWPAHVEVTGWWLRPPSTHELPAAVLDFLGAAPPPLHVGFGSMPIDAPERIAGTLLAALRRSGDRAIVSGLRTRELEDAAEVLLVDDLPHEVLFPRVKAVVHHGGSGTVGSSLAAGRPTLVIPFIFDQFFWGRRVHAVGAGPRPIPFVQLTPDRLADAFARLGDADLRAGARRAGELIAREDGVARAVDAVERVLA